MTFQTWEKRPDKVTVIEVSPENYNALTELGYRFVLDGDPKDESFALIDSSGQQIAKTGDYLVSDIAAFSWKRVSKERLNAFYKKVEDNDHA